MDLVKLHSIIAKFEYGVKIVDLAQTTHLTIQALEPLLVGLRSNGKIYFVNGFWISKMKPLPQKGQMRLF